MQLTGRNDHSFTLSITGYEFPDGAVDEWDANWLLIRVDVRNSEGTWSKAGPYLLTDEVARLAEWLEDPVDELDFMEPNLSFELVERSSHGLRLRVWFEIELRPDWAESRVAGERDLSADLTVSRLELTQAAAQLRGQLAAFPPRAGIA